MEKFSSDDWIVIERYLRALAEAARERALTPFALICIARDGHFACLRSAQIPEAICPSKEEWLKLSPRGEPSSTVVVPTARIMGN